MEATATARTDEEALEQYLRKRARTGEFYFKSKFIAEDVGLSASQIGTLLADLQDSVTDLTIEKWSYTNATTWRVTPASESCSGDR